MQTQPGALAPYASDARRSRGRRVVEPSSPTRSEFQRDRDRIVHSTAFRRLAQKTQVFLPAQGDHFRTRLTHTIEVAQIARALARGLALDDDLAEALALAHDLGHPPFGHTGEQALDACLAAYGGFDHNAQALKIVTRLERRYAGFDGLNLTWETLEGLAKHNGPLVGPGLPPPPAIVRDIDAGLSLALERRAGPEAQAAAIADDIAYDAHDLDDGLRAGLLELEELRAVPFLDGLLDEIARAHGKLEPARAIHELGRRVITRFIEDALRETGRRVAALAPRSQDDVRGAAAALVAFSPEIAEADRAIKAFLFPRVYRHASVVAVRAEADRLVRDLFAAFMAHPERLPPEWRAESGEGEAARATRIGDYIAGMTDRYAMAEARRVGAAASG